MANERVKEQPRSMSWSPDLRTADLILEEVTRRHWIRDADFDKIFSPRVRAYSKRHWTPVGVAQRAAEILSDGREINILDIGSGAGKFCFVGALTTPSNFFGVEQREWLVKEAEQTKKSLKIPRVHFFHQEMSKIHWSKFDAFYLFNPFFEQIEKNVRIDDSIEMSSARFRFFVYCVQMKLAEAKIGTRVVTFHGFGGNIPFGYQCELREACGSDFLELWVKKRNLNFDKMSDSETAFTD